MKEYWTRDKAHEYRHKIEHAAAQQTDEDALQSIDLFPAWKAGIEVVADERYQYNGVLYRCVQGHTTQEQWTPDVTPALWMVVSVEEWPEWIQPLGSEDAYHKDDKTSHNGFHWISDVDDNVWEPGVYGWTKVE